MPVIEICVLKTLTMAAIHLLIRGKVQGVFYRASARDKAEALGIRGWIRNTNEGDVEAVVTGTEEQLYDFANWCRKGPSSAIVTEVKVSELESTEDFKRFSILR